MGDIFYCQQLVIRGYTCANKKHRMATAVDISALGVKDMVKDKLLLMAQIPSCIQWIRNLQNNYWKLDICVIT